MSTDTRDDEAEFTGADFSRRTDVIGLVRRSLAGTDTDALVRQAFERYFADSRKSKGAGRRPTFELLGDGTYADDHTQRHWWTWQQARADTIERLTRERDEAVAREREPLNFDQLQSVIASHFGGRELTDDEADSAEAFARAVERAHGIRTTKAPT